MKNLLIYLNPNKKFDYETEKLARIQIENSLALGYKIEDIKLITNFSFSHCGVQAKIIEKGFCSFKKEATKVVALLHLFEIGFIKDNELYWCHDFDAYQLEPITEEELGLKDLDGGFTDYGRKPNWQMGSFFIKKPLEDIIRANVARIKPGLDQDRRPMHDEYAMIYLTDNNVNNVNSRIKRLNITYNFGMRKIALCYEKAIKPIKVLHFHPRSEKLNTLKIAMYGENDINKPLMNKRLIKLFKKYGYS